MITQARATIEDLYKIEGKAELVNGETVEIMPTGGRPGYAGDAIFVALWNYVLRVGIGRAVGENKGFHVHLRIVNHSALILLIMLAATMA